MPTNYRSDKRFVSLLALCRSLREGSTDAEQLLWRLLRNRQVAGAKFRRQHQYGRYILDFYCVEQHLAVEVDGGQHYSDSGVTRDVVRTHYLEGRGVRLLRFSNIEVLEQTTSVLEQVWSVVTAPSP